MLTQFSYKDKLSCTSLLLSCTSLLYSATSPVLLDIHAELQLVDVCMHPKHPCFGLQLVPAVTELVISELLWLNYSAPEKPVYVYLNSIGSQGPDGQAVGFETEAYAILDTLAYIRPEIHTLVVGQAYGNAAMILASGKKGSRFSLPNARIMTAPPRMNRSFGSVSNMMIKANELEYNTQSYVDFLSQYTGALRPVAFWYFCLTLLCCGRFSLHTFQRCGNPCLRCLFAVNVHATAAKDSHSTV